MSSFLQQYCDVTESMAFKSCELNSSSSMYSSKSNEFKQNKLKCFNCYGLQAAGQFCPHCGGTSFVTDTHPFAMLLNEVLCHKFGATQKHLPNQSQWNINDYQQVQTIRQEEEQLDQRKIICDLCNKECDINYKFYCQCCECFFVCVDCADRTDIQITHQHPLATNKKLPKPLFFLKRTTSDHISPKNKDEPLMKIGTKTSESQLEEQDDGHEEGKRLAQYFNVEYIIEDGIHETSDMDGSQKVHSREFSFLGDSYMAQSIDPNCFKMLDSVTLPLNHKLNREESPHSNPMLASKRSSKPLFHSDEHDMHKVKIPLLKMDMSESDPDFGNCVDFSKTPDELQRAVWKGSSTFNCMQHESEEQEESIYMRSSVAHHDGLRLMDSADIEVRLSMDFNLNITERMGESIGPRESFNFRQSIKSQQICNNCYSQLKEVYSMCRTCQKSSLFFKLCSECADSKQYSHNKDHQMIISCGIELNNILGRRSEMVSESVIESEEEEEADDSELVELKITKKKSSLEKRPPLLLETHFMDNLSDNNKSFCKIKAAQSFVIESIEPLIKENQINIFGRQSVVALNCESLYNSQEYKEELEPIHLTHKQSSNMEVNNSIQNVPNLSRFNSKKEEKPKVAFMQMFDKNQDEDQDDIAIQYVDSDSQVSQQDSPKLFGFRNNFVGKSSIRTSQKPLRSMKHVHYSDLILQKKLSSSSRQITSSISYNRSSVRLTQKTYQRQSNVIEENLSKIPEEYIFYQYSCDQCGCHPIKNVRYHCMECEDFDVCGNCYENGLQNSHGHHGFEMIDGLRKIQQKRAMLLQRKDLNKGKDTVLRNTHVSMLAKTKKTVELVKKSVNQLSSSISGLSKIHGFSDLMGNRGNMRMKVQN